MSQFSVRFGRAWAITWVVLFSFSTEGFTASISLVPLDNDPAHAIVLVVGNLLPGDDIAFRTQVGRLTKAVVAFNSDGGNLLAGIAIGKTIRLKSFATVVLDGQRCASACATAWLGGSPRFMASGAHVGFHAAYIKQAGRANETGVGNALLGSYLTQIGLSESAVIYITQAAPTEMTWLTLRDAEQIGIEVVPWASEQTPAKQPAQPPVRVARPSAEPELRRRAQLFVSKLNSKWSDAAAGLAWLDAVYADQVDFYGKQISRGEVLAEKRSFTERWPERSYTVQPSSMNAACDERLSGFSQALPQEDAVECIVTGIVEWKTRSSARKAAASGLADFTYVLLEHFPLMLIHNLRVARN
jgi:hypothetical protein